jgi:signal transduction histidine kinase
MVTCYPGKLNQVFLNIITNAIFAIRKKFGDKSGGLLCVKTYAEGDFVFVSIKDDGTGMDDATKAKLFEPFFTTKKVGEGTGLGMSIAFTIIEQHYADLTVHSTLGEGTEFILRLPVQPPKRQEKDEEGNFQNNDNQKVAEDGEHIQLAPGKK